MTVLTLVILELRESGNRASKAAEFSVWQKKALVCFNKQNLENDVHTWKYPEEIRGMRGGSPGHWTYDDLKNKYKKKKGKVA